MHRCDLDRRIEERVASRSKARAEGNYELIALEQNRLGELCVEHKSRLDSMLFFWIIGGLISVAGWARASYMPRATAVTPSAPAAPVEAIIEALRLELQAQAARQRDLPASPAVHSTLDAELIEASMRTAFRSVHDEAALLRLRPQGHDVAASNEVGVYWGGGSGAAGARELAEVERWQRWTCAAAVSACALSAASLIVASRR